MIIVSLIEFNLIFFYYFSLQIVFPDFLKIFWSLFVPLVIISVLWFSFLKANYLLFLLFNQFSSFQYRVFSRWMQVSILRLLSAVQPPPNTHIPTPCHRQHHLPLLTFTVSLFLIFIPLSCFSFFSFFSHFLPPTPGYKRQDNFNKWIKTVKKWICFFEMHTGNMVHTSACNAYLDVLNPPYLYPPFIIIFTFLWCTGDFRKCSIIKKFQR